ncbi:MAG: PAS domain-containing protein [Bacteroidota bacterium]
MLQEIINASPDSIILVNKVGLIIAVNQQCKQLFGYEDEELIDKPVEILLPENLTEIHKSHRANYQVQPIRLDKDDREKFKARRKDGSIVTVSITLAPTKTESSELIIATIKDEKKLIQRTSQLEKSLAALEARVEELKMSEATLKKSQEIGKMGYWRLDLIKNHLYWSDLIFEIFETDPKQFKASYESFMNFVHPDDRVKVNTTYLEHVENRKPYDIEHRLLLGKGKIKWVNERCNTFYDNEGKPIESIGTVQDITEAKNLERKNITFRDLLLENSMRSQEKERNRIAMELHDGIIQEMVALYWSMTNLKAKKDHPDFDKNFQSVISYMKDITNNIRLLSHSLISPDLESMDLPSLLGRLQSQINLQGEIAFDFDIDEKLKNIVVSENLKTHLFRIIQELASNVFKHSGANLASIKIEIIGGVISLVVNDNGKGLKKTIGGIGMKNIGDRVSSLNGKIQIRNQKQGGLKVEIDVPFLYS